MSTPFIVAPVVNIVVIESNECVICLECVNPEKNCCVTDCGHKFHTNCLLKNCERNNFNCPMCRHTMVEQIKFTFKEASDSEEFALMTMASLGWDISTLSPNIVEQRSRGGLVDITAPPMEWPDFNRP